MANHPAVGANAKSASASPVIAHCAAAAAVDTTAAAGVTAAAAAAAVDTTAAAGVTAAAAVAGVITAAAAARVTVAAAEGPGGSRSPRVPHRSLRLSQLYRRRVLRVNISTHGGGADAITAAAARTSNAKTCEDR